MAEKNPITLNLITKKSLVTKEEISTTEENNAQEEVHHKTLFETDLRLKETQKTWQEKLADEIARRKEISTLQALGTEILTMHSKVHESITKLKEAESANVQKRIAILSGYKALLFVSKEEALKTAHSLGKTLSLTKEQVEEIISTGNLSPVSSSPSPVKEKTKVGVEKRFRVTVDGKDRGLRRSNMELSRTLHEDTRPSLISGCYTEVLKRETGIDVTILKIGESQQWLSPLGIKVEVTREV